MAYLAPYFAVLVQSPKVGFYKQWYAILSTVYQNMVWKLGERQSKGRLFDVECYLTVHKFFFSLIVIHYEWYILPHINCDKTKTQRFLLSFHTVLSCKTII